jgi:hypothetical protein
MSPPHSLSGQQITITVVISDGIGNSNYTFILKVVNTAPTYSSALANKTMNAGEKLVYCMPTWVDTEGGTITASGSGVTFGLFNGTCWVFEPVIGVDGGMYSCTVVLSDGYLSTTYNFKLTVNQPPKFTAALIDQSVQVG